MRRRCPNSKLGPLLCAAGAVVLLTMILPVSFWWFALGVSLIAAGVILILRSAR